MAVSAARKQSRPWRRMFRTVLSFADPIDASNSDQRNHLRGSLPVEGWGKMEPYQNMPDQLARRVGELTVQNRASDYRLMAAVCLEVANKMPLNPDRARMIEMAQKWLELAQRSEAEKLSEASQQAPF
jgi:hypothetical protein